MEEVTKKPESLRKKQSGGRLKPEMFKQLPVLESEVVGKKEDGVSKVVRILQCKVCKRNFNKKKQLKDHLVDHRQVLLSTVKKPVKAVAKRKRKLFSTKVSFLDPESGSESEFNVSPVKKQQKLSD